MHAKSEISKSSRNCGFFEIQKRFFWVSLHRQFWTEPISKNLQAIKRLSSRNCLYYYDICIFKILIFQIEEFFSAKLALFVEISTLFRIIHIIGKIIIFTSKIKLNNIKIFFQDQIKNSSRISNWVFLFKSEWHSWILGALTKVGYNDLWLLSRLRENNGLKLTEC